MKKSLSLILVFLIALLNLNACDFFGSYYENLSLSSNEASADTTFVSSEKNSTSTSSKKSGTQNKSSSSKKPTSTNSVGGGEIKVEEPSVTDNSVKEPANVGKIKEFVISSKHTALKSSSYYQYSSLNSSEKSLYNLILTAIKSGNNVINFKNPSYSNVQIYVAFQKVLTDHPQFFYVARNYWYVCAPNSEKVAVLILSYFDGSKADEIDDNLNFTQTADRNIINQKIDELKVKIEEILLNISVEDSEVIKEKKIYDHVLNTIKYDKVAAENAGDLSVAHSFDLYGAVMNNSAVCEGYAKLFQYLCYCVGINSTQVIGIGEDDEHMWNAVLIENDWYQVDLTWSDTSPVYDYSYFNITAEKMSQDHKVDASILSVPNCNSTKNSFINVFAIELTDLNTPPTNYEKAISNIIKSGDNLLYIYVNRDGSVIGNLNFSRNFERYINNYMLYEESEFSKYLSAQGKTLYADIIKNGDFYILTLK